MKRFLKVAVAACAPWVGGAHAFPAWSGDVVIDHLRTHGSGYMYANVMSGTPPCGTDGVVFEYPPHPKEKETFAILLAAVTSGSTVRLYVDRCDGNQHSVITGARIIRSN